MPEDIKKETIDNETAENKAEEIEIEGADEESTQTAEEAKDTDVNETESVDDASADADEKSDEKKGLFKKKKKDKKDEQIEELNDRLKRQMAEFDNFRKRTIKEKAVMYDDGVRSTIEKLLTVIDNLERAVAKLMVRNDSKEIYTLKNPKGVTYATVRLNNYKFINLANKFYTFRHVATLDAASETPSPPSSYSVEAGNFGNIADNNGYLIDPYFFDKTVAGATTSFTGGSFYTNHLSKQTDSNWSGLADAGKYVSMYCLENCMFRPAQNTVYTTGIMLKGTFTPEASQTIGTDGQPVEDPLVFKTLYYFNYKFYTTLAAVGEHGDANIDGLTEASSDADLAAKQITRFTKNEGNFSTFYNYWIKHLDNGDPTTMGVMEFGIVRNNIYSVNITSIKNLGPGTPDTKPDPDEYKAYLDVEFGVYPWIVRDQDADLE